MGKSVKNMLKEEYNRLKKAMEKITSPGKKEAQLILQPVSNQRESNKKYLRGNLR